MTCAQTREHLACYADGELDPELRRRIADHLAGCQPCRTQIERWQALRRCAQRVLTSAPLPPGLETRIRQRLRRRVARRALGQRALKLSVVGLAAAAVILLALTLLPRRGAQPAPAGPLALAADELAAIYQRCAVTERHDPRACRGKSPAAAARLLAARIGFKPYIPDLSPLGYALDGVCQCLRVPDAHALHAYYRRDGPRLEVVSFFSVDRRLKLKAGRRCRGPGDSRFPRSYELAQAGDQVYVLKWDERDGSFALCARMGRDELLRLAGAVDFARLLAESPALARLTRP